MDVRRRNGLHPSSDVWDDDGVRHPDSDDDDCNGKGGAYDFDEAQVSHSSSYKPKHVDVVGGTKAGSHALNGHPAASPGGLNAYARCIPWILLAVSAFTRFYRLDEPRGNVFGEMGGTHTHSRQVQASAVTTNANAHPLQNAERARAPLF